MQKILVIDDDRDLCLLFNHFLGRKGYQVAEVYSGRQALDHLQRDQPDLVLCDLQLGDIDGLTLLASIKEMYADLPVIIITAYSDIRSSANALKQGAYDYVTKPLLPEDILLTIRQALNRKDGEAGAVKGNRMPAPQAGNFFWGNTESFRRLMKQVKLVAVSHYNVILYGESGSGREALAYEIHKRSRRSQHPFVIIHCGALTAGQEMKELFGNEEKAGHISGANGGTVLFDEVESLPAEAQEMLLKILMEKKFSCYGSTAENDIDIRVLISSTEMLWNAAYRKKLNEELYHRLNDFAIMIPPLRERREDIIPYARHFLQLANQEADKKITGFTEEAEYVLRNHDWHDNVRELRNMIKRAVIQADSGEIGISCLPAEICSTRPVVSPAPSLFFVPSPSANNLLSFT